MNAAALFFALTPAGQPAEAAIEVGFLRLLNRHPKVVMMTTGWFWGQWTNRPHSLQVVRTQTMAGGSWVIAVQDKPPPEP